MRKLLTLCFILLSFYACKRKKSDEIIIEKNAATIDMTQANSRNFLSLDDQLTSLTCINLETVKNSEISNIDRLIVKDSLIFIFDRTYGQIKAFNRSGKFLFSVGKRGTGPGEFRVVEDMAINEKHNTLLVLCGDPKQMQEYSLQGKFLRAHDMLFYSYNMAAEGNDLRYYYCNQTETDWSDGKNILVTDTTNYISQRLIDFPKNIVSPLTSTGGLYSTNKEPVFNPPLTNKFYELKDGTANCLYKVNFGSRNAPTVFKSQEELNTKLNYFSRLGNFFAKNAQTVGFTYVDSSFLNLAIYNPRTHHIAKNDGDHEANRLFSWGFFSNGEQYISTIDTRVMMPFLLTEGKTIKNKFPEVYQKLVSKKLTENPSLILFTVKDF